MKRKRKQKCCTHHPPGPSCHIVTKLPFDRALIHFDGHCRAQSGALPHQTGPRVEACWAVWGARPSPQCIMGGRKGRGWKYQHEVDHWLESDCGNQDDTASALSPPLLLFSSYLRPHCFQTLLKLNMKITNFTQLKLTSSWREFLPIQLLLDLNETIVFTLISSEGGFLKKTSSVLPHSDPPAARCLSHDIGGWTEMRSLCIHYRREGKHGCASCEVSIVYSEIQNLATGNPKEVTSPGSLPTRAAHCSAGRSSLCCAPQQVIFSFWLVKPCNVKFDIFSKLS